MRRPSGSPTRSATTSSTSRATPEAAGKRLRKDEARGKATFVSLLGLEGAQAKARDLVASACDSLAPYGSAAGNLRRRRSSSSDAAAEARRR